VCYVSLTRCGDDVRAECDKYYWGQNETEVFVKVRVPAGTKSKAVKFDVSSTKVKLAVLGETILDAALHRKVTPDDCTFTIEDSGDGRLIVVTLAKMVKTSASQHWKCVCGARFSCDPAFPSALRVTYAIH
jgi:hypothetical protein